MSKAHRAVVLLVAVATGVATTARADVSAPEGVSPGSATTVLTTNGSCPTFSWAADPDGGFELTVVPLAVVPLADGPATEDALLVSLPAGALSWTPSPEQCLRPGTVYGWAVRSLTDGVARPWSRPLLFRVSLAPTPDEVARAVDILTGADAPSGTSTGAAAVRSAQVRPSAPMTPAATVAAELEGDAGMFVEGIVEVNGLLSQSADAGGSSNIVADGEISTPFNIMEVPRLYLNPGGQLSSATWFHSPTPGELEIGRGTGSEPDAHIVLDLLFVSSLSTSVLSSASALDWIGGGGSGVDDVPLNGSNQIRLDSAGDECPAGTVATGIRLKVVDTNQAGVELECSD